MVRPDLLNFVWNNLTQFDNLTIDQVNQMLDIPDKLKWGFWTSRYGGLNNMPDPTVDSEAIITPCLDMPSKYALGIYISKDCFQHTNLRDGTYIFIKTRSREFKYYIKRAVRYLKDAATNKLAKK